LRIISRAVIRFPSMFIIVVAAQLGPDSAEVVIQQILVVDQTANQ
jgi:hypothetical protein